MVLIKYLPKNGAEFDVVGFYVNVFDIVEFDATVFDVVEFDLTVFGLT